MKEMNRKHINTTIIQCHTLTNDSEEKSKDAINEQLEARLDSEPWHEIKPVTGDLNTRLGNDNTSYEKAKGIDRCDTRSTNKKNWRRAA